jgi:hypothetical protein
MCFPHFFIIRSENFISLLFVFLAELHDLGSSVRAEFFVNPSTRSMENFCGAAVAAQGQNLLWNSSASFELCKHKKHTAEHSCAP